MDTKSVQNGFRYLFIYDHRNNNYFIPSSKYYYFLSPHDPIYNEEHKNRKPFIKAKIMNIRCARISMIDNRFNLKPGTVFYLLEREIPNESF